MVDGINTKKADVIIQYIIEFCLHNNFPKEFGSDNGAEFKNTILKEFCSKHDITFVQGVPYNPHAQGTIKRFHYTIKKYLGKEFISNGCEKIDFQQSRIKIINIYNNKVHRIIGTTPNIAYKITDPEIIKKK